MMEAVGIDFGTTNSLVARHDGKKAEVLAIDTAPSDWSRFGFDNVMPSVTAHDEAGRVCFGWEAKQKPEGRFDAVKRMFATQLDHAVADTGEALAVEEVATMLFAELRRRSLAQGIEAGQAVITVPASSKGRARHRTKICAGMAGFEVLQLLNEPTAAAMAYAQRHPEARQLLVFDWGGGTLDVTILHSVDGIFIEQASSGNTRLGGLDFDSHLERLVRNTATGLDDLTAEQRHELRLEVERAKLHLSEAEATSIQLPSGSPLRVTRSQFEQQVQGLINESRDPIERCLSEAGVGPGTIDALVLVGGTCRIPAVRRFVQDIMKMDADPDVNPMTAIAEGAAIAASILSGKMTDSDFFVCLEHSLGTFIIDHEEGGLKFSPIIRKGNKLPARSSGEYSPVVVTTDSIKIRVVEGDPDSRTPDLTVLKEWDVPLKTPYSEGSRRAFDLSYEYDVNGILHVTATDQDSGTILLDDDVAYGIATDKKKLKAMSDRAQSAVATGVLSKSATVDLDDPEAAKLIEQALVKVIPFLDASEAKPIQEAVATLESAGPEGRESAKTNLKRLLSPFSYLF